MFQGTYRFAALVGIHTRRLVAYKLLARFWMLAFREASELLFAHFYFQSIVQGKLSLPFAVHAVVLCVVVLLGI
jgi:hypothetical protein